MGASVASERRGGEGGGLYRKKGHSVSQKEREGGKSKKDTREASHSGREEGNLQRKIKGRKESLE